MQGAVAGTPATDFANVVTLEQQAGEHHVGVDTPDTAPTEDEPAAPREKPPTAPPPTKTGTADTPGAAAPPPAPLLPPVATERIQASGGSRPNTVQRSVPNY
jgi:hypothetical protein